MTPLDFTTLITEVTDGASREASQFRMTDPMLTPEDIGQDVAAALLRRLGRNPNGTISHPQAYGAVCARRALGAIRKRKKFRYAHVSLEDLVREPAQEESWEGVVAARIMCDQLVASLPEGRYKKAAQAFRQGLRPKDIPESIGTTDSALLTRMYRASRKVLGTA